MSASTEEELWRYFNGFLSDDEASETEYTGNLSTNNCVKINKTDEKNSHKENTSPQLCGGVSVEDALWEYFNQSDDDVLSTESLESNCMKNPRVEVKTNNSNSNDQALKLRPRVKLEKKLSMKSSSIIAQEKMDFSGIF